MGKKQDYTPTRVGTSTSDRPIYLSTDYLERNYEGPPAGEAYSEWSRTMPVRQLPNQDYPAQPGTEQWSTIPSVDQQGHIISEDELMQILQALGTQDPVTGELLQSSFGSLGPSIEYARNRSGSR